METMKIGFEKYEGILGLISEIEDSVESVNEFIEKFKRYTGIKNIKLASDNVFEIEDLDFQEMEDLESYFTIQELIHEKYFNKLIELIQIVDTREEFCEKATRLTGVPVKQYGLIVRLNNIDFKRKKDVLDYLKAFKLFEELSEKVYSYEVSVDGRGVLLDGIAFVHDCEQTMLDNGQDEYPIEGFLKDGKVHWQRVDKSAYTERITKTSRTLLLKLLSDAGVTSLYLKHPNEFGITEKPYPVAILDKNRYVYLFRGKDV